MEIKPNLFLVGNPKCATTFLSTYLNKHPKIFVSKKPEPHYFLKDFKKEADENTGNKKGYFLLRNKKDYFNMFDFSYPIVADFSTQMLYSKTSAKEIFDFNPNAKILIVLREPVDFLISYHADSLKLNHEKLSFKEAIEAEDKRKKMKKGTIPIPSMLYYSERIKYTEMIKRYYNLFPKENIKVLFYEDIKKNPKKILQEILQFLGLKEDFNFGKIEVVNKRVYLSPLFFPIHKIVSNYYFWSTLKSLISYNVYYNLREKYYNFVKTNKSPKIDPNYIKQLKKRYEPEVRKLESYLKIDLKSKWGY